jgi:2-polyprenyl-6-hydroxyphenyl methylase/3-demethylubiquinone-9 3-methyltransferase
VTVTGAFGICKVCRSGADPIYTIEWPEGSYDVYRCGSCDLHYLAYLDQPQEGSSAIPDRIDDGTFGYIDTQLQNSAERFSAQVGHLAGLMSIPGRRILDIGAGGGKFLSLLREKGGEIFGIEPNVERIAFARQKYGISLRRELVEDDYWQGNFREAFDAVTMWDVIEHANDPVDLVACSARLLKQGGYMFMDTPSREGVYYRLGQLSYRLTGGRHPFLLKTMYSPTPFAHKQIFTVRQIEDLLARAGMELVHSRLFHELSFPYSFYLRKTFRSAALARLVEPFVRAAFFFLRVRNKMLIVGRKRG